MNKLLPDKILTTKELYDVLFMLIGPEVEIKIDHADSIIFISVDKKHEGIVQCLKDRCPWYWNIVVKLKNK